ncbi:hypothetical protein AAFF_G00235040 [Aldrovandia affinis]|uniref:Uncharacterized protein n=1 Tax=Aldrovandia affinis TaxID=143900 RepID=A0AAD7SV35_9TELE|nr:hypothetical protein AAFF_G00235040 [Aldrovandia affinis]
MTSDLYLKDSAPLHLASNLLGCWEDLGAGRPQPSKRSTEETDKRWTRLLISCGTLPPPGRAVPKRHVPSLAKIARHHPFKEANVMSPTARRKRFNEASQWQLALSSERVKV